MRTYYLFMIKPEYYTLYKNDPSVLYQTLYNLYHLEKSNFSYGISLFQSLCQIFSVKLLKNYIQSKYKYDIVGKKMNLHFPFEKVQVQINYSCVIIKSNVNFPEILKVFYIYDKKIFVCDFENKDYFWLSKQIQKIK